MARLHKPGVWFLKIPSMQGDDLHLLQKRLLQLGFEGCGIP
jgi:hypothetical protein